MNLTRIVWIISSPNNRARFRRSHLYQSVVGRMLIVRFIIHKIKRTRNACCRCHSIVETKLDQIFIQLEMNLWGLKSCHCNHVTLGKIFNLTNIEESNASGDDFAPSLCFSHSQKNTTTRSVSYMQKWHIHEMMSNTRIF